MQITVNARLVNTPVTETVDAENDDLRIIQFSAVGAAVGLFHRLEDLQNAPPVKDATTHRPARDRKHRRKEQEKKKALGHKEDDAGGWDWEMRM